MNVKKMSTCNPAATNEIRTFKDSLYITFTDLDYFQAIPRPWKYKMLSYRRETALQGMSY